MRSISLLSLIFSLLSLIPLSPVSATDRVCAQVIQYAENTSTSECQAFPTPCDVPSGWTPVSACTFPEKKVITPKFEVQKFASCDAMESRVVDILKRYQDRYWYPYPVMYARDGFL
jgi:hypothetical protein